MKSPILNLNIDKMNIYVIVQQKNWYIGCTNNIFVDYTIDSFRYIDICIDRYLDIYLDRYIGL